MNTMYRRNYHRIERNEREAARAFEDQYTEPSTVIRFCGPCGNKPCAAPQACRVPEPEPKTFWQALGSLVFFWRK